MKKSFLLALGIVLLLIAACQTKPKPTPSPSPSPSPAPTAAPTAAPANMGAEDARAQELRDKCIEYGLNETDAYADAMAKLEEARKAAKEGDADKARSLYAEAIAGFEKTLGEGLAGLAVDYRGRADKMREAAENEGAADSCPDQMAGAAADYEAGDAAAKAVDLEKAVAAFKLATARYEIAYERAKTVKLWDEIDAYDLQDADKGNYELAQRKFEESDEAFPTDANKSLDAMQESELRFNIVYKTAWELGMTRARTLVDEKREYAKENKAEYAVPMLFDEAQSLAEEAEALEADSRFPEAEEAYAKAAEAYGVAADEAIVKRDDTQIRLDEIRRKREASHDAAVEGDALLGGKEAGE